MSHIVVCRYHYRENSKVRLTPVTVWLFFREGVAKSLCKCGLLPGIYRDPTFIAYLAKKRAEGKH